MNITSKGSIFSLDLMLAFVAVSFLLFSIIDSEAFLVSESANGLDDFGTFEKALLVSDSLVKNLDSNNSLLGSAFFDSEKRRVVANFSSIALLSNAQPASFGKLRFVELSIQRKLGFKETIFSTPLLENSSACFGIERFVILNETREKALLKLVACNA